jgi:hypothetical protein
MRGLLRHVNVTLRNKPSALDINDTRMWKEYIMSQYRAGAVVKDKDAVKQLRTMAVDVLANCTAVAEQKVRPLALLRVCVYQSTACALLACLLRACVSAGLVLSVRWPCQ